ncbi:MarR family transcriptional regulator [Arthrobacter sp. PGP41]|uniref:MarR family transcriptional regulator n=1 Tax=unclassified Arthrobacter TaxID=235627 RepID=UPI000CDC5328|nr:MULTISPECIES: MarR family transcriptional regulator [unclassified Arthrobacter]AUZ34170.1 MarR family transcriptional regulator [Arthrobacter sp. PGP41]MDT0194654.1 MarR family transcriptional regulator [Arthrobacter sp. AB6]
MYVLTIDQRGSTSDVDRVPDLIAELRSRTRVPFERSVGDELQGVVEQAADVVDIALHALRSGYWYVGIGIGAVNLVPGASPREGSGSGFVAARKAVELAKGAAGQVPLSVVSGTMVRGKDIRSPQQKSSAQEGAMACSNAQAVLRLIGRLVQQRTEAQWRVVDQLRVQGDGRHGSQKQVARDLGITEQSVSRAVLRSGWQEEWAARPAAAMLLDYAQSVIAGTRTEGNQ